jgi:hypothetical protein
VRCRICNEVEKKKKLLVPKFDGLQKHVGQWKVTTHARVAIGHYYITNMLKMSNNILHFMGELLWFNKLQLEIL